MSVLEYLLCSIFVHGGPVQLKQMVHLYMNNSYFLHVVIMCVWDLLFITDAEVQKCIHYFIPYVVFV